MTGMNAFDREQFFQMSACEYYLRGHCICQRSEPAVLMSASFFFSERVVNEWNLLPQEVVDATFVNQFKNRLDKYWQICER